MSVAILVQTTNAMMQRLMSQHFAFVPNHLFCKSFASSTAFMTTHRYQRHSCIHINQSLHRLFTLHSRQTSRLNSSTTTGKEPLKTLLPNNNELYSEEDIVKKSRFIGLATHCTSWEEAQVYLEQVRKEHPKSRHVCFGVGSGGIDVGEGGVGTERCSDDGEPTGTAGVPILGEWLFWMMLVWNHLALQGRIQFCRIFLCIGSIKGEGLSDTLCIVVRYFGKILVIVDRIRMSSSYTRSTKLQHNRLVHNSWTE